MLEAEKAVNQNLWKRVMIRFSILFLAGLFLVFAVPKVIHLLFPFLIALIVARLMQPLIEGVHRKLKIPPKIIAGIFDVLIFMAVFSMLGLFVTYLVGQAMELAAYVERNWEQISAGFRQGKEHFTWLVQNLPPEMMELLGSFEGGIVSAFQSGAKMVLDSLVSGMAAATAYTGNFFVSLLMAVMAAYYMASDYEGMMFKIKKFMGKGIYDCLVVVKRSVISVLGAYLKSMFLLAGFAFVFMLAALLIYGQPYAFFIAFLLAVVDFLPLIGTIAVLIPWGIIEMAGGSIQKGIYLVAVGIIFYFVRQIVSPKIVGIQTGLHPLAALVSMYVGLKQSGVFGAIFAPMAVMLALSVVKSGVLDSTIADFRLAVKRVASILRTSSST